MEKSEATKKKSEPALAPEWLKAASSGVSSSGGGSFHHFASSSQSDDHAIALPTRNWSSVSFSDHDSPRSSAFTDRTSSSYFRRSSSTNGSMMHDKEPSAYSRNYSSFKSHRDRDWDKDLDFRLAESTSRDYSDSLSSTNILTSRIEKEKLSRSQSMISGKRGEVPSKRVGNDMSNGIHTGGNIVSSKHKSAFDINFPTLVAEEKQGVPDIGRVSSPGLSTACQSLPMSTLSGCDGWTSALAALPAIVGSNSTPLHSAQQTAFASSAAVHPSISTGLNMAETLAQAPSRARTAPQISVETQRLEEWTRKQCRQLIPMTPSMPKNLVLNSSEKTKTKVARTGESSTVAKVGQQPSSSQLVVNIRGSGRADTSKTSQLGKLHPLKGPREINGVSSTPKDGSSPTSANRPSHGALRSPNNPKLAPDPKLASSTVTQSPMDRKPLPHAQNRIDFFNSLRKKTAANHSAATPDSSSSTPSVPEKPDEQSVVIAAAGSECDNAPASKPGLECSDWSTENGSHVAGNGDACKESEKLVDEGEQTSGSDEIVIPDEEAAFLRRLGWEENAKHEALTPEEISAFINECKEKRPASKLFQRMEQLKNCHWYHKWAEMVVPSSSLSSSNSAFDA